MGTRSLSREQWNRTLLQRQHLLERVDEDAVEVIDRCVGLQSQDPQAAFFGLWSRVRDFDPGELDSLIENREVVRMALQRGTVFAMDGLDARWIRAAVQPVLDAEFPARRKVLGDVSIDDVVAAGRDLLPPETGDELDLDQAVPGSVLRGGLAERWPDVPPEALTAVVRAALPLVQVPPRGLWRRSGAPRYLTLDQWIGEGEPAVDGKEALADLVRMYLRGFGPATRGALNTWSGLTGMGALLDEMEADWELEKLTGPDGQELFDLEGLPIADGGEPAPVRLIAPFDNVLVANGDRGRVADPGLYARTVTKNGRSPGFVLIDGWLAGTWRLDGDEVAVTELRDLDPVERAAVDDEAALLAGNLAEWGS